MELVNLMYSYINRFINIDKLIEGIKNIDLNKYDKKEQLEIKQLKEELEKIKKTIPNEIDETEKNRLKQIEQFLTILSPQNMMDNCDEEAKLFAEKKYQKLLKEKEQIKDGGKLYERVFELLTECDLIDRYVTKMNERELLEFITNYIYVSCPPRLNQEEFNNLVKSGIKEDKRESLWRLAVNYNQRQLDFSLIEDYFIEKRDDYYLGELISAVTQDLDIDNLIKKVLLTKDIDFINEVYECLRSYNLFTDKELQEYKEKYLAEK